MNINKLQSDWNMWVLSGRHNLLVIQTNSDIQDCDHSLGLRLDEPQIKKWFYLNHTSQRSFWHTVCVVNLSPTLPFCLEAIWPLSHRRLGETTISSNVTADASSAARPACRYSQYDTRADFAQARKHSATFAARLKGCLDELKHRAFLTRSWRLWVSRKKKRRGKKRS